VISAQEMNVVKVLNDKLAADKGAKDGILENTEYKIVRKVSNNEVLIGYSRVLLVRESISALEVILLEGCHTVQIGDKLVRRQNISDETEKYKSSIESCSKYYQSGGFGFKAGITFSGLKLHLTNLLSINKKKVYSGTAGIVGFYYNFTIYKRLIFQIGADLNLKSIYFEDIQYKNDIMTRTILNLSYFQIPSTLHFQVTPSIHILTGGYYSFYLNGNWFIGFSTDDQFGSNDYGLLFGIEYIIHFNNSMSLPIALRYDQGLGNISSGEVFDHASINSISITIGVLY
jgi:hypothetical protein